MRRVPGLLLAIAVAGCAPDPSPGGNEVDIANAARAAQAFEGEPEPETAPHPAPRVTATPAATVTPAPEPTAQVDALEPSEAESTRGAAAVVQNYYALIEARKYRQAWRMWDRDGAASGMSAAAFADSFAKYRDYRAEVGAPGRIDAGAGQRYVTVPVKVTGTLRSGAPFAMEGPVMLHRTGDIDGATEAQRRWRIFETGVRPRPATAASATPDRLATRYRCIDGRRLRIVFDKTRDLATLIVGEQQVKLAAKRTASGIRYAGEGHELRGTSDAATLTRPDNPPLPCTAIR